MIDWPWTARLTPANSSTAAPLYRLQMFCRYWLAVRDCKAFGKWRDPMQREAVTFPQAVYRPVYPLAFIKVTAAAIGGLPNAPSNRRQVILYTPLICVSICPFTCPTMCLSIRGHSVMTSPLLSLTGSSALTTLWSGGSILHAIYSHSMFTNILNFSFSRLCISAPQCAASLFIFWLVAIEVVFFFLLVASIVTWQKLSKMI